ncbi:MAG: hypothetical protein IJR50_00190, partial [Treponema sp.]|nr:hypothetical protein [Treponema sp.]
DEERNISPTIHIAQHENGAKIREFADYSFNLFANSKPPELLSPTVLNDASNENDQKFVVAFRVPHPTEYGFYMRHQDIAKLTIAHTNNVWEFPVDVGHNGHITINEGSDYRGGSCTLTTSDEDPSSKSWNAINGKYFPYAKDGLNYYLETNMAASGDAAFTLTLTDSAGLTSSVTASTRMPKLSYPEISKKGESYTYSSGVPVTVACAQGETTAAFVIKAQACDVANNPVSGSTTVHWKLYKTTSGHPDPVAENSGSVSNDVTLSIVPGTWRIVSWAEKAGYEKSRTTFVDVEVRPPRSSRTCPLCK